MDIEAELDPEVAVFLSNSPVGALDFGALQFSDLPALREAMANMPKPPLPPTRTVYRDQVVPGPDGDPDVTAADLHRGGAPAPICPACTGSTVAATCSAPPSPMTPGSAAGPRSSTAWWSPSSTAWPPSTPTRRPSRTATPACSGRLRHATELGIDPDRLVIGGASAGAGLAAGLALLARDRGEVAIAHQLLIYPMIDDRHANVSSGFAAPIWNKAANVLGWRAYLGSLADSEVIPIYAAPARAKDLSGLPPATIVVGTIDVFRDEDIDYAARLLGDGVSTELHVYPGAPHGFEMMAASTAVAKRCQRDLDDALQRAFRPRNKELPAGAR